MKSKTERDPAFETRTSQETHIETVREVVSYETMFRDDCAMQVLNGMVIQRIPTDGPMFTTYAQRAYAMADYMLAARKE